MGSLGRTKVLVVGSLSHLGKFGANVSSYNSESTVRLSSNSVYV